ncbi:putative transcriptional regulator [Cnuella takakiae]|uniref:Putative transcriptional regulator n=1 Tax=Cnuella takakiae TaxID=1302690 RepID=A0A1M5CNC2_9BACT|nr:YqgE/AlgH family protein [Cnuella takakiae]OLY91879.1 hypothetical protein BUE76_08185 [Cnuella takakiae]SHF55912.1 putative transcriptional regulator [Cnuella takakiae]
MQIQAGIFLRSTKALRDTYFEDAVLYIAEHNSNGAVGFVINKTFGRSLNELVAYKNAGYFPLFAGGPVDTEHLFILHQSPELIADAMPVAAGIYMGGNFDQAVAAIRNNALTTTGIKIFVGYCGWDTGELEAEVEEGSWELVQGADPLLFAQA